MDPKEVVTLLARMLNDERNAASDLWTWLPSYGAACRCHGDHAGNFMPDTADIMKEAAKYFSHFKGGEHSQAEKSEWFSCPCGECEGPESCDGCPMYADAIGRCRAVEAAPKVTGLPHDTCPFKRKNGGFLLL